MTERNYKRQTNAVRLRFLIEDLRTLTNTCIKNNVPVYGASKNATNENIAVACHKNVQVLEKKKIKPPKLNFYNTTFELARHISLTKVDDYTKRNQQFHKLNKNRKVK